MTLDLLGLGLDNKNPNELLTIMDGEKDDRNRNRSKDTIPEDEVLNVNRLSGTKPKPSSESVSNDKSQHFPDMITYKCKNCGKEYNNRKSLLRNHFGTCLKNKDTGDSTKHGDRDDDEVKPNRMTLLTHVTREINEKGKVQFKCNLCWKYVTSQENILSHLEGQHFCGDFTYNCQHCNKQFNSRKSLQTHLFKRHRV